MQPWHNKFKWSALMQNQMALAFSAIPLVVVVLLASSPCSSSTPACFCSCSLSVFVVVVCWAIADGAFRIYYYDLKVHKPLEGRLAHFASHNWHNQPKAERDKISRRAKSDAPLQQQQLPFHSLPLLTAIYLARLPPPTAKVGRSHKEALQLEVLSLLCFQLLRSRCLCWFFPTF